MYIKELKLDVFVEYVAFNEEYFDKELIRIFLKDKIVFKKDGKIYFIVTGFISVKDQFIVVMPKTYNLAIDEETIVSDIRLLFQVLIKYNSSRIGKYNERKKGNNQKEGSNSKIASAYFLINDYLTNGIYRKQNITESENKIGNPKWNKTVQKKRPIISGSIVLYDKIIYSSKNNDLKNLVVMYHKLALKKSIEKYGWILNVKIEDFNELNIDNSYDVSQAKSILNRELRELNAERQIDIIKCIQDVLIGYDTDEANSDFQVFYSRTFHFVWEAICGSVFSNQYLKMKELVPLPVWNLYDVNRKKDMSQIPDILVINEKYLIVLDAKFYDLDNTIPGWPDVVKQFFYAHTIKENLPNAYSLIENKSFRDILLNINTVSNAFAFPTFENIEIKKVGEVTVNGSASLGRIDAYELNVRDIMNLYVDSKTLVFMSLVEKAQAI